MLNWFKKKAEPTELKYIVAEMDRAIETLKNREEYRKNAIIQRSIRRLSGRLEEISKEMMENMVSPQSIHSQPYAIEDLFGEMSIDDLFILRGNANDNAFSKYLYDNKLTMAVDNKCKYVMFAYGRHAWFDSCWGELAGYDY